MPLSDDETVGGSLTGETLGKEAVKGVLGQAAASTPNMSLPSATGLSFTTKMFAIACIAAVCFLFVKAHTSRRSRSVAGRHGAYEKSLP